MHWLKALVFVAIYVIFGVVAILNSNTTIVWLLISGLPLALNALHLFPDSKKA